MSRRPVDDPSSSHRPTPAALTSGSTLARNTALSLIGTASPILIAIPAIPVLVHALGTARFGILALVWAAIGSFSVFDLGLGRSLTQQVAKGLAGKPDENLPATAATYLALLLGVGVAGGTAFAALSDWLAWDVLDVPADLRAETRTALLVLAPGLACVTVTAGLRGLLEAYQRFDAVTALRVPLNVLTLLAPIAVLPFSHSLVAIVLALVAIRVASLIAHIVVCRRLVPLMRAGFRPRRRLVRVAVRATSWITATNVLSPLMLYPDRLIIGATVSVSAVAFYATPHDLMTKLAILPMAPIPVLFPAFATSFAADGERAAVIFRKAVGYLLTVLVPLSFLIVAFAHELLDVWLGGDFADESTRVLQWLALGVLFQGVSQPANGLLQAIGRADLTAKLLMAELPLYLAGLWIGVNVAGLEGAAVVWLARSVVDAVGLQLLASWQLRLGGSYRLRGAALAVAVLAVGVLLAVVPSTTPARAISFALAAAAFGLLARRLVPIDDLRLALRAVVPRQLVPRE